MEVNADGVLLQLAAVVAIATALGPHVKSIIEALKSTPAIKPGWSGVWAMGIGTVVGILIGLLAMVKVGGIDWLLTCAIGGLLAGTQAVTSHLAEAGAQAQSQERYLAQKVDEGKLPEAVTAKETNGGIRTLSPTKDALIASDLPSIGGLDNKTSVDVAGRPTDRAGSGGSPRTIPG